MGILRRKCSEPEQLPMIVKNFRQVTLDKQGYRVEKDEDNKYQRDKNSWFGFGPVFEFDLYFAKSRRYYGTEYVRARDNRQAKRKIKRLYPWVTRFEWGDSYAD